jgi:hypothetical protein
MTIRLVALAALFCVGSISPANAQGAKKECALAAMTDYNRESFALSQKDLLGSVETTISQRRLQERYCLRLARCLTDDTSLKSLLFVSEFTSCLRDEALEEYDAKPR